MRYLFVIFTALAMIAGPASAFDMSSMTDEEREAFRSEVRAYLLDNPEVIFEAIDILRAQEEAQAALSAEEKYARDLELVAQHREELFDDGFSYIGGNPDGDLTIVEFLDYRCGYCRQAHPEFARLLQEDGNIKWIVKEYPILGLESVNSSRVALATLKTQGDEAYLRMHNALMQFGGPINETTIRRLARSTKVDADKIIEAYDSEDVLNHITQMRELGQKMEVSGTPTFLVGDVVVRGYIQPDRFRALVKHVREDS